MSHETHRLRRDEFLRRGTGLVGAASGLGLVVPKAFAAGEIRRGGVLQYVYTDGAATQPIDPASHTFLAQSAPIVTSVYDKLTYSDLNWNVSLRLAERIDSSPDAKTWTFKLRRGVMFHDGSPLTSKDVAWTMRRILDPKVGSGLQARASAVLDPSGIKTPDSRTVVFKLKKPDAQFALMTSQAQVGIVQDGNTDPNKHPVGTGPFRVKAYNPSSGWQILRNPNWWRKGSGRLPYLDGVEALYIAEPTTKVQAVTNGRGHISDGVPFTAIASLQRDKRVKLAALPGVVFYNISMDSTQEPFTDPRVAQAVKAALDRKKLLSATILGHGTTTGDVPALPSSPFYPSRRGVPPQDIATAKRLLAAGGHSSGIELTLYTTQSLAPGMVEMAVAFKQIVAPAGIDVAINKYPGDTFFSDVWLKKPMFVDYWNYRHPREILSVLYKSDAPWNESKFKNRQLDTLIDAGAATVNRAKQRAIFRNALNLVANQSGTVIPFFVNRTHVMRRNVNGVQLQPQVQLNFERAWLA